MTSRQFIQIFVSLRVKIPTVLVDCLLTLRLFIQYTVYVNINDKKHKKIIMECYKNMINYLSFEDVAQHW